MAPPFDPKVTIDGSSYFPPPYSRYALPHTLRTGLVPVGVLALLSVGTTSTLIIIVFWRLLGWRQHHLTFLGYNQYVILVLNLLLADLQQGSSYLLSFHWVRKDAIMAPSSPCFAQGWLLHSGDVSSGFFVLAIAMHTYYTAVMSRRISHQAFAIIIVCLWVFAYLLAALGVLLHGNKYFTSTGAWCWVSVAYEIDRLMLHYVWVFLVQLVTVVIYIATFLQLRHRTKALFSAVGHASSPNQTTIRAVNRVTRLMTLYPCVYVLLTLPLSAGRMWSMAHGGRPYSDAYAIVAGCLLTSCGWVDSLLYTLTRKRLLRDTMVGGAQERCSHVDDGNEKCCSKGITQTRSVTIVSGEAESAAGGPEGPVGDSFDGGCFDGRQDTTRMRAYSQVSTGQVPARTEERRATRTGISDT